MIREHALSPAGTWAMFALLVICAVAVGMLISIFAGWLARHVGTIEVSETMREVEPPSVVLAAFDRYHIAWWDFHRDQIGE
jgi:hypothetical protein